MEKRKTSSLPFNDPVKTRVVALVQDLGNTVLTKKAAGDLYGSVTLYRSVLNILMGRLVSKANSPTNSALSTCSVRL